VFGEEVAEVMRVGHVVRLVWRTELLEQSVALLVLSVEFRRIAASLQALPPAVCFVTPKSICVNEEEVIHCLAAVGLQVEQIVNYW